MGFGLVRAAEGTNEPLNFYVVSEQKFDGARFIDTPELPKVGYIGRKPDMIVTNLEDVHSQKAGNPIVLDIDGKGTLVTNTPLPELSVSLSREDAKRFATLTQEIIGKRLLVMQGEIPLTAPNVRGPIPGGRFTLSLHDEAQMKRMEAELKKLIQ